MVKLLQALYDYFYTPRTNEHLMQVATDNHRQLIESLSKEDRKKVLRIIDAKDQLAEIQSIDSFIHGFRLAAQLFIELNFYGNDSPTSDDCSEPFEAM